METTEKKQFKMTMQLVIIIALIGLMAGTLSGLIGVGGGIIIVPALIYFVGFSQYQAQGTSLGLLLLPVGILAVLNYYHKGYIDFKVIGIMSIAFVAGGYLGSKLSLVISEIALRRIFAIVLFYTAFKMLNWDKAIINLFK